MQFKDKRITVMGIGRFGGGLGVAQYLLVQGAFVCVTDLLEESELRESIDKLKAIDLDGRLKFICGRHNDEDFTSADLLVVNPSVPPNNPYLTLAVQHGVKITTEIEITLACFPSQKKVAITGSAGKSTTTALLGEGLKAAGVACVLGGNIGGSLLNSQDKISLDTVLIFELSSFMLERLAPYHWDVAVFTNLLPNHLDWHGSFDAYKEAKARIFLGQRENQIAILGRSVWQQDVMPLEHVHAVSLSAPIRTLPDMRLPGQHNQMNFTCAYLAIQALLQEVPVRSVDVMAAYTGLPHRLQFVSEVSGVRYYNDSKCTTPEGVKHAVQAFEHPIHIILGGYEKNVCWKDLMLFLNDKDISVYAIGETKQRILEAAQSTRLVIDTYPSMEEAFIAIQKNVQVADVVLLSPGTASWDQFPNYEKRGELFVTLVEQL